MSVEQAVQDLIDYFQEERSIGLLRNIGYVKWESFPFRMDKENIYLCTKTYPFELLIPGKGDVLYYLLGPEISELLRYSFNRTKARVGIAVYASHQNKHRHVEIKGREYTFAGYSTFYYGETEGIKIHYSEDGIYLQQPGGLTKSAK